MQPNNTQQTPPAEKKADYTIPSGFPIELFKKAMGELKPTRSTAITFDTKKQRNAQFIQKGLAKPGRVSFDTLRRSAQSVHIVRICITVLKEKITKTKWAIKPIDPLAKVDEAKIKKVEELFKHPNQNDETFRTMLDKILEDLLVLDSVAIEKTRYPSGELAELHFVDGASIRPVYDEFGNQDVKIPITLKDKDQRLTSQSVETVSYLQVLDNSQYGGPESGEIVAFWPKKDFLYFHMHPQGSMEGFGYGLSPIESVLSVVANILNADNYNGTYFEEGSFPPVILQLVGQMKQEELDAMREYLYQELTGNFHRPAIMAGGAEAKVLDLKNLTNNDMQFMEYMKFLARLCAAAYGLSGQDIGLTDDLNKATATVQQGISEDKGYSSILHLLKEVFNQEIIWKDFGYTELEFDWVADDKIDPKDASDMYDKDLRNGTRTLNEVRQHIGEEPFGDWADTPMILTGDGYVPLAVAKNDKEAPEIDKPGNETPYKDQDFTKSIYTPAGYKTYFDDRGYGQPFIFVKVLDGTGYVIKPPVAVNATAMELEEHITHDLNDKGLNVAVVTRMSYFDVVSKVLFDPTVRVEFDKYTSMTPEYDSEKWRGKFGGGRKFPYYLVSNFIDGYNLASPILQADMKRDPESYKDAVRDLAALWRTEKEMILGDRRADQYIITPSKRAYGFDYQFMGDKERWVNSSGSLEKVLIQMPALYDLFKTLTSEKKVKKSIVETIKSIFTKAPIVQPTPTDPMQQFEKNPVMFGELVNNEVERHGAVALFSQKSDRVLLAAGFTEKISTYDWNIAVETLKIYTQENPTGYGGLLTVSDNSAVKYCVYVKG